MQRRVTELLDEISLKNEAVDDQVDRISDRLQCLEQRVTNLPEQLALVMRTELKNIIEERKELSKASRSLKKKKSQ